MMTSSLDPRAVDRLIAEGDGVLRLEPAWVARDWLPPGRRLGLEEHEYDLGERGSVCERWLASTTRADNAVGPADEGLSYVAVHGPGGVTLDAVVRAHPTAVLGAEYAATHPDGLGRLAKIFDYGARIPYHIHPREQHSRLVGRSPKDEAYWFPPDVDRGPAPESFFGVHPWIGETGAHEVLLPFLEDWDSDAILQHSRGFWQVPGEGFHIPSGILHAPGTALTIELQEPSDCLSMFQALNAGRIISKDLLYKDVRPQDREREGERFLLSWVDWEANADPYFYENHHLSPQLVTQSQLGGEEHWIYYGTPKFSGKRLTVRPGATFRTREQGVHNVLAWRGTGTYAGHELLGGTPGRDELLVVHDRAVAELEVHNSGTDDLVVLQFFGPDINLATPGIPRARY
jgi:hypothetical protein